MVVKCSPDLPLLCHVARIFLEVCRGQHPSFPRQNSPLRQVRPGHFLGERRRAYRPAFVAYRKAGYSRKFREEHEQEFLHHQAAKNAFDEMGVKKLPKVKEDVYKRQVPNHLTEQWASEFLRLYPSANILVTTKKDFETHNRKKFCARIRCV